MPIVYPLDFPTDRGIAGIKIRQNSVVEAVSSPYTAVQQVQVYEGQWWEAQIKLPPLKTALASKYEAFFGMLNGSEGTFTLGDPARKTPIGAYNFAPGTPVVYEFHAARAFELTVATGLGETPGYIKAGCHLQIGTGNNTRLHKILNDLDLAANGRGSAYLWPRLRTSLNGGEAIVFVNPKGMFRLAQSFVDFDRRPGVFTDISLQAREAL